MLRFIHCADLHFDRSFEGLHLITEVKALPLANEQVLENIVTLALAEAVDFVLFAGDTFHQNRPSLKTQHQFFQQMDRLREKKIPVYMIFGNHDFFEKERYLFDFSENIHLFTEEKVATIHAQTRAGIRYAISGFSYRTPWLTESKVAEFPEKQTAYHIGMYHGDSAGEHYAPFQLQEMKRKNYDYWALGHVHVPTILAKEPPIVYPGTPQGHTQKENNIQGVQLVTLDGPQAQLEARQVATITWCEQKISLADIRTQKAALEKIQATFTKSQKQLVKLQLTDTEQLPVKWLNEKEKPEMIAYLNDFLTRNHLEQIIYQIELQDAAVSEKLLLSGQAVAAQLLENYREPAVFEAMIAELADHGLVKQTVDLQGLQAETLQQVTERLANEFRWSEEEK